MANSLRIIDNNVANKATLTASNTAGSLIVNNLKTNVKSQVYRSTGTTTRITAAWAAPEQIACVALPFCNLTSTATIRVQGTLGGTTMVDTGVVLASAYAPFGMWNWGNQPLGVNSFSYTGAAYARVWFTTTVVDTLLIDIVDVDNTAGYVEFSRLVTGIYWSPEITASQDSVEVSAQDNGKQYRTEAGDLFTDVGTRNKSIKLNIEYMSAPDRSRFMRIVLQSGLTNPVFLSVFPDNAEDPELEQTCQIYGKLSSISSLTSPYYNRYSAPLELEEI